LRSRARASRFNVSHAVRSWPGQPKKPK
jgi:hypothetical protein